MKLRPLLISDCDEVLLHFVAPFEAYLQSSHDLTLHLESFALGGNIRRPDGQVIAVTEFSPLLDGFFDTHMSTQTPAPGAVEALATLAEAADIVILTNVGDQHNETRTAELARLGMPYRVITNAGPKGPAVLQLLREYSPTTAVFIDDLPPHHRSVRQLAPQVHRLHMVADPRLRPLIAAAPDADARIDDWAAALPYLQSILGGQS